MDIFFAQPSEIPLPPDEVRILALKVDPYPDGRRVRLFLELTPFQKKPNGDIAITGVDGMQVASASFIEAITPKLEMTLHLKADTPLGQYKARAILFYTQEIEAGEGDGQILMRSEKVIIDEKVVGFEIGP